MGRNIFRGFCLAVLGAYTTTGLLGYEWTAPSSPKIPSSVRAAPGGFRSFHFWHSGYHGGK